MKVRITEDCLILGVHRSAGEIHDIPVDIARSMIACQRVTAWNEPAASSAVIETREPEIENREPTIEPKRRGRPPKNSL